jgi:hypothetical protein
VTGGINGVDMHRQARQSSRSDSGGERASSAIEGSLPDEAGGAELTMEPAVMVDKFGSS